MSVTILPSLHSQSKLLNWNTSSPIVTVKDSLIPPIIKVNYLSISFPSDKKILQQFLNFKSINYSWLISTSNDGLYIIIVKNNNIELRSSKNQYSLINFQCQIYKDLYPQFRTVSWSSLSNYFAISFTNGVVNLWDLQGAKLIIQTNCTKLHNFDIIIKVIIIEISKIKIKVYIFTLNGKLYFYNINNFKIKNHLESNIKFICTPILCCESTNDGNIILFGTYNQINKCENEAFKSGIILCRLIDEDPFITPSFNREKSISTNSWYSIFSRIKSSDGIFMLRLSKDNTKLAALHCSGKLSIWNFPSLTMCFIWRSPMNISNTSLTIEYQRNKVFPRNFSDGTISNFCWWDNKYVAVALRNGLTIILSYDQLVNLNNVSICLLPFPQLEEIIDKTFFALNCISTSSSDIEQKSLQVVENSSWNFIKTLFNYFVSDSHAFTDFRSNFRTCSQSYTLFSFKLTTPEELFTIRINNKEYSEALLLATEYNLDSDIVFQKQWRDSEKSIKQIKDILIKIKKRNWILNECLTEMPNDIESMKFLLKLGLYLTDIDKVQNYASSNLKLDATVIEESVVNFRNSSVDQSHINSLKIEDFNLIQIEMIRIRMKILIYCDKLTVYEQIINISKDAFDSVTFNKLKNLSSFEIAIKFARQNNIIGLNVILKLCNNSIMQHFLTILSNIPECVEPKTYQNLFHNLRLLTEIKDSSDVNELDWCESNFFSHVYNKELISDEAETSYYQENPIMKSFILIDGNFSRIIIDWCHWRIRVIESETFNTSFALEILQIFKGLNIQIDHNLEFNLRFLNNGVYNCQISNMFISLAEFELLSDYEKANMLMSKTSPDRFLINFNHWILPMLKEINVQSTERSLEFFQMYLTGLGKKNIVCIMKLLEDKEWLENITEIIKFRDIVKICLIILLDDDMVLNINECANLAKVLDVLIVAEVIESDNVFISELKQLKDVENYISVLRLLEKYELKKTLKFVHENRMNGELVENLITNMLFNYFKSVKNVNKSMIKLVFTEIQVSLSLVFKSVHPILIYKNLLKSMLETGDYKKINLACEFMILSTKLKPVDDDEYQDKLVDFPDAVQCILAAVRNYINSSVSSKDEKMSLAKYCLEFIENATDEIKIEKEIIKCAEFLDKWNCSMVPIELRSVENRFDLLRRCLDTNKCLYKEIEEIIHAGAYFYKDKSSNVKFNEGEVLRLIAQKAWSNNDIENLKVAMSSLLYRNHKPCWEECIMTLKFPHYPIEEKHKLGRYAVTYCPDAVLMDTLKYVKAIELSSLTSVEQNTSVDENSSKIAKINSKLVKQPIKFLSSGLTDLSSRVNLKSLIDKSSETLVKFTSHVSNIGYRESQEVLYKNDSKCLKEMSLDLIYKRNGRFSLQSVDEVPISDIIKMLTLSSVMTNHNVQNNRDEMHLKILKYNITHNTALAILHGIFITDINLITSLRNDIAPNTYTKALIYSMIGLNLITKYKYPFPLLNSFSTIQIQSIMTTLCSEITENELSIYKAAEEEFKDYLTLDNVIIHFPSICQVKFFSSVDYRKEIILQLCEFSVKEILLPYAKTLAERYNVDRYEVLWNYFISFVTKCCDIENYFEKYYDTFTKVFNKLNFIETSPCFSKDLEKKIVSGECMLEFKVILKMLPADCAILLFNKSPNAHKKWMDVFEQIFTDVTECDYLDLCNKKPKILSSLKKVINSENMKLSSELLQEFHLSEEFSKIKNELSLVLASQTLWSTTEGDMSSNNNQDFLLRFEKSLENFSINDFDHCKNFIFNILFEKSEVYISTYFKINLLKNANKYINDLVNKHETSDLIITKWEEVKSEMTKWLGHIENTILKVVHKLKELSNISNEIVTAAEYMAPDNYWQCLVTEILLLGVSYQDFFTLKWDLNINSGIIIEAVNVHICHICLSKFLSLEKILKDLSNILEELDDYLDIEDIERILECVLNSAMDFKEQIHHMLLNEFIFRLRKHQNKSKFPVSKHILRIMKDWGLAVNENIQFQKSNINIIDSLMQDCDSPTKMTIIPKVIELIELVKENNNLWQCWIKTCIIKGPTYCSFIFQQFQNMKTNKLYIKRIGILAKEAVQSLSAFNTSEAISILILMDPIDAVDQVQVLLVAIKSDPSEFTNTMKNINLKALQIIIDCKLVPLYAKTILYQRLVNFITKEMDEPNIVQEVLEQLREKGYFDEATWLTSSSHINPAMKTIEMVSGFWKRFSSGTNN